MPLSTNPVVAKASSVSNQLSTVASQAGASFTQTTSNINTASLSATVDRLSGGITSGLNGLADGIGGAASDLAGGFSNTLGGAIGGLGDLAGGVANGLGNLGASLSNSIPGLGSSKSFGDLIAGIENVANEFASDVAALAGQLDDLLSLRRAANLPSNAELFQSRGALINVSPVPSDDWRVRIRANWQLFNSELFNNTVKLTEGVAWPYLPEININTTANYNTVEPVHNNYPFHAYKNSSVSDISISGEFSCETERDAYYYIGAITFFKTVTKMFYGASAYQGNPPPVCQLSGYGGSILNNIPVLVKNFEMTLPKDVNYIKCNLGNLGGPTWVPSLSTITVSVVPIYNRSKLRQFSLQDYASGDITKNAGYL